MMWKDNWRNSAISSDEAKEKWPFLLLDFLENRVVFQQRNQPQQPFAAFESKNAAGDPVKIWCKCLISRVIFLSFLLKVANFSLSPIRLSRVFS